MQDLKAHGLEAAAGEFARLPSEMLALLEKAQILVRPWDDVRLPPLIRVAIDYESRHPDDPSVPRPYSFVMDWHDPETNVTRALMVLSPPFETSVAHEMIHVADYLASTLQHELAFLAIAREGAAIHEEIHKRVKAGADLRDYSGISVYRALGKLEQPSEQEVLNIFMQVMSYELSKPVLNLDSVSAMITVDACWSALFAYNLVQAGIHLDNAIAKTRSEIIAYRHESNPVALLPLVQSALANASPGCQLHRDGRPGFTAVSAQSFQASKKPAKVVSAGPSMWP